MENLRPITVFLYGYKMDIHKTNLNLYLVHKNEINKEDTINIHSQISEAKHNYKKIIFPENENLTKEIIAKYGKIDLSDHLEKYDLEIYGSGLDDEKEMKQKIKFSNGRLRFILFKNSKEKKALYTLWNKSGRYLILSTLKNSETGRFINMDYFSRIFNESEPTISTGLEALFMMVQLMYFNSRNESNFKKMKALIQMFERQSKKIKFYQLFEEKKLFKIGIFFIYETLSDRFRRGLTIISESNKNMLNKYLKITSLKKNEKKIQRIFKSFIFFEHFYFENLLENSEDEESSDTESDSETSQKKSEKEQSIQVQDDPLYTEGMGNTQIQSFNFSDHNKSNFQMSEIDEPNIEFSDQETITFPGISDIPSIENIDSTPPPINFGLGGEKLDFKKDLPKILRIGNEKFKEKYEGNLEELDLFSILFINEGDSKYGNMITKDDVQIFHFLASLKLKEEKNKKFKNDLISPSIHVRFVESAWNYYVKVKDEELKVKDFFKYIKLSKLEKNLLFDELDIIFWKKIKGDLNKKKQMVENSQNMIMKIKTEIVEKLKLFKEFIPEKLIDKENKWFDQEIKISDKDTPLKEYKTGELIPIYSEILKRKNEFFEENFKKMIKWKKFKEEIFYEKNKLDKKNKVSIPEYLKIFEEKIEEVKGIIITSSRKGTNFKIYKEYFKEYYKEENSKFDPSFQQIFRTLKISEEDQKNLAFSIKNSNGLKLQYWEKVSIQLKKFRNNSKLENGGEGSFSQILFKFMEGLELVENSEKFNSENYSELMERLKKFQTKIIFSRLDFFVYLSKSKNYLLFLDEKGEESFENIKKILRLNEKSYRYLNLTLNFFSFFFNEFKKFQSIENLIEFVIHSPEANLDQIEENLIYFSDGKKFLYFEKIYENIYQNEIFENIEKSVDQILEYDQVQFHYDKIKLKFCYEINFIQIVEIDTKKKEKLSLKKKLSQTQFQEYFKRYEDYFKILENEESENNLKYKKLKKMNVNLNNIILHLNYFKSKGLISSSLVELKEFGDIKESYESTNYLYFKLRKKGNESNEEMENNLLKIFETRKNKIKNFFEPKLISEENEKFKNKYLYYFKNNRFFLLKHYVLRKLGLPNEINDHQTTELESLLDMIKPDQNLLLNLNQGDFEEEKIKIIQSLNIKSFEVILKLLEEDQPKFQECFPYPICYSNKISYFEIFEEEDSIFEEEENKIFFEKLLTMITTHKIKNLMNIQILNCEENTTRMEVLAFCELSLVKSHKEVYLILFPEKLQDKFFYELVEKYEKNLEKKIKNGNENCPNNTLMIFKNCPKKKFDQCRNSIYFFEYELRQNEMKSSYYHCILKKKYPEIRVFFNKKKIIEKNLMEECQNLEIDTIKKKIRNLSMILESMKPKRKTTVLFNFEEYEELDSDPEKLNYFFFQVYFLNNIATESGIFSLKDFKYVAIETRQNLKYKHELLYSILNYQNPYEDLFESETDFSDRQIVAYCFASQFKSFREKFEIITEITLNEWKDKKQPICDGLMKNTFNQKFYKKIGGNDQMEKLKIYFEQWVKICAYFFKQIDEIEEFKIEKLKEEERQGLRFDFINLIGYFALSIVQLHMRKGKEIEIKAKKGEEEVKNKNKTKKGEEVKNKNKGKSKKNKTKKNKTKKNKTKKNSKKKPNPVVRHIEKDSNFNLAVKFIPIVKNGKIIIFGLCKKQKNFDQLENIELKFIEFWKEKWVLVGQISNQEEEKEYLRIYSSILGYSLNKVLERKRKFPNLKENKNGKNTEEGFIITKQNLIEIALFSLKADIGLPIILVGEEGFGKKYLIKYVAAGINQESIYTITIHPGLTKHQFVEFMKTPLQEAKENPGKKVWILFNDFNTNSPLQDLIAKLMKKKMHSTSEISYNVVFVGYCNPELKINPKKWKFFSMKSKRIQAEKINEINPSLLQYLSTPKMPKEGTEALYIKSRIQNSGPAWLTKKVNGVDPGLIELVTNCLEFCVRKIRKLEGPSEGNRFDIERLILFMDKIYEYLQKI